MHRSIEVFLVLMTATGCQFVRCQSTWNDRCISTSAGGICYPLYNNIAQVLLQNMAAELKKTKNECKSCFRNHQPSRDDGDKEDSGIGSRLSESENGISILHIVNLTNELKAVVKSVTNKLQEQEEKIRNLTATVDLLTPGK